MKKLEEIILKNAKSQLTYSVKAIDKAHSLVELEKAYSCFYSTYEAYGVNCREYAKAVFGMSEFLEKMQDVLNEKWDLARKKYNERLKHEILLN